MPPTPVILPSGSAEIDMGINAATMTTAGSNMLLNDTALIPPMLVAGCYDRTERIATAPTH